MKHPIFIVVEGLDGSGKSTLCRALAARLGAVALTTPPRSLTAEARRSAERMCDGQPLARMLFYASSVAAASADVRVRLERGERVIMDRYWLSTLTYHRLAGVRCDLEEVARSLTPAHVTVFLNVSTETRHQRLVERGELQPHDRASIQPGVGERLAELYREASSLGVVGRFLEIAADDRSVDQLVDRIVAFVDGQGGTS